MKKTVMMAAGLVFMSAGTLMAGLTVNSSTLTDGKSVTATTSVNLSSSTNGTVIDWEAYNGSRLYTPIGDTALKDQKSGASVLSSSFVRPSNSTTVDWTYGMRANTGGGTYWTFGWNDGTTVANRSPDSVPLAASYYSNLRANNLLTYSLAINATQLVSGQEYELNIWNVTRGQRNGWSIVADQNGVTDTEALIVTGVTTDQSQLYTLRFKTDDLVNAINVKFYATQSGTTYTQMEAAVFGTQIVAIPEPATIGMVGLGALITLLIRRLSVS